MKNQMCLSIFLSVLLFTACGGVNKPEEEQQPAKASEEKLGKNDVKEELTLGREFTAFAEGCETQDVDFVLKTIDDLTFCVNREKGVIEIKNEGKCQQTLKLNDVRRWALYSKGTELHFTDVKSNTAATLKDGYPVIGAKFRGDADETLCFKAIKGDTKTPYLLIGTDDYRHLHYSTLDYNIYNSTTAINNYIDFRVFSYTNDGGDTLYGMYIRQSQFKDSSEPALCKDISTQGICKQKIATDLVPCQ